MILEIQHETRLEYSEPVAEWVAELRMEPLSDQDQTCQSFHLKLSQPTSLFNYRDGFGNRVHHFNVLTPHREVRALAASIVETHPMPRALEASIAPWPFDLEAIPLEVLDFLRPRGPVCPSPRLAPVLDRLRPSPGTPAAELLGRSLAYIQGHFTYARDVTSSNSPIDDVLEQGKGVCQDFAHLLIAILRSFRVPARYVSGYIHRPNKESQSHAWVEVWLPDLGWIGVDPTNNCTADESFVKVARGRDFTDVPPNKGVFRGRGVETISVRVETRALDRRPPLSWQEQLPPLHTPLTAMRARLGPEPTAEEEAEQQQQ